MTKQTEDDENPKEIQVPSLQNDEKINSTTTPPSSSSPKGPKLSLKDYYLSEYDDQEDSLSSPHEKNPNLFLSPQLAKTWRTFLTIFAGFLGLVIVIASLVYLWVSDRTGDEETKAAKSVADIAMSLTYAQLKNIHPQNQNWSHPEFIRNNLTPILAPNYLSLADVDSHGQFANCSYMLRIHSSSDLSQFLVIAQPCPSLLQWLIPKASIIVDSRVMEMRKMVDLKALNRLIVNSNNLDELSTHEISRLVSQGELIPLSSLVNKAQNQGMALPKALGLIRPGAENRLYNAPRYYLLGERILNHSLDLVDKFAGNKEINLLQQELNTLVHFHDLVLYTPGGIQHALKAQKALTALMPNDTFLIAYLQLNNHGKITNTHLLIDDSQSDIANAEVRSPIKDSTNGFHLISEPDLGPELTFEEVERDQSTTAPIQEIDTSNPLFFQLSAMASSRHKALKPISDEIVRLLKKQTLSTQPEFTSRLIKLQQKYMDTDREEQNKIFKKFHTITQDHQFLPAVIFLDFIQVTSLKTLFQEYLLSLKKKSKELQISDEQVDQQFQNIQASTTWQELEQHTAQINQLLQFDRLSDEGRLISFQNSARSIVTQKLNQFILSSTEALPPSAFNPEYLQTLSNIIKSVWITDPDMHDFYISEFELREPSH